MYINITDSVTADNKGSSAGLVHYLDKENRTEKQMEPEFWFNGQDNAIPSYRAREAIDHNIAKLSRTDAKFFLINISPSQKEIAHLKELYGEHGAEVELKKYAAKIMNKYAVNFKRPGIKNHTDLLWFGKLEHHRYYSFKDKEVENGTARRGDKKPGEQMHIQIIVSRKDITNKIKLSPMNKSRGKNTEHSQKMGQFDRSAFKASGEHLFDERYEFERSLAESFHYANTQKNGSLEQRMAMYREKQRDERIARQRPATKFKQSTKRQKQQPIKVNPSEHHVNMIFKSFLAKPTHGAPLLPVKKKKKKKGQENDQTMGMSL